MARTIVRNDSPEYLAWRVQRRQQNREARAIRSAAMARRAELRAALEKAELVAGVPEQP